MESLALRWRDVDLDAGPVSVRRSAGMVRVAGESAEVTEGGAKSGKPPVIDLDAAMVAVLPHTGRRAARSSSPQARRPRSGCTIYGTPTRRSC